MYNHGETNVYNADYFGLCINVSIFVTTLRVFPYGKPDIGFAHNLQDHRQTAIFTYRYIYIMTTLNYIMIISRWKHIYT